MITAELPPVGVGQHERHHRLTDHSGGGYGAGVRPLAQGLPGLEAIVPVVGEPSRFAASVCDLLLKDTLWEQRCADQIAYARERFMPAALHDSLLRAMHPEPAAHLVAAA